MYSSIVMAELEIASKLVSRLEVLTPLLRPDHDNLAISIERIIELLDTQVLQTSQTLQSRLQEVERLRAGLIKEKDGMEKIKEENKKLVSRLAGIFEAEKQELGKQEERLKQERSAIDKIETKVAIELRRYDQELEASEAERTTAPSSAVTAPPSPTSALSSTSTASIPLTALDFSGRDAALAGGADASKVGAHKPSRRDGTDFTTASSATAISSASTASNPSSGTGLGSSSADDHPETAPSSFSSTAPSLPTPSSTSTAPPPDMLESEEERWVWRQVAFEYTMTPEDLVKFAQWIHTYWNAKGLYNAASVLEKAATKAAKAEAFCAHAYQRGRSSKAFSQGEDTFCNFCAHYTTTCYKIQYTSRNLKGSTYIKYTGERGSPSQRWMVSKRKPALIYE
ncbi:hypothetical protein G7Y79_00004g013190 [Physcia stellaris]|nr:hypothetical protein G7Y79_00004g013190 [Physcia stellaris]